MKQICHELELKELRLFTRTASLLILIFVGCIYEILHHCWSTPTWLAFKMLICSSYTVSLFFSRKPLHWYSTYNRSVSYTVSRSQGQLFSQRVGERTNVSTVSAHLVSKVNDDEGDVGHARFLEVRAAAVLLVELLSPVQVGSPRDLSHDKGNEAESCYEQLAVERSS